MKIIYKCKNYIILAILISSTLVLADFYKLFNRQWLIDSKFQKLNVHNSQDADIIFIGDSLVARGEWKKLFESEMLIVVNWGIGSITVKDLLRNLMKSKGLNQKMTIIMVGINDIFYGRDSRSILQDYIDILESGEFEPRKTVVTSILRCNVDLKKGCNQNTIRAIDSVNQNLKEYAESTDIKFLNLNKLLTEPVKKELAKIYTNDGVHLNDAGYTIWKNEIIKIYRESHNE